MFSVGGLVILIVLLVLHWFLLLFETCMMYTEFVGLLVCLLCILSVAVFGYGFDSCFGVFGML